MEKIKVGIITNTITMDKLLKFSGIASTGGQAFAMVSEGIVYLNGKLVTEKRKQVHVGDVVRIEDEIELTVVQENEA